jgi:exopolysaccharide biosynthesis polyprenyl glycosylphosphotransferase
MKRRPHELLIVGTNDRGDALAGRIESAGMKVVGFVDSWPKGRSHPFESRWPILGDLEKLDVVLRDYQADGVVFVVPRTMIPNVEPAVNLCAEIGVPYWIAGDLFSHETGRIEVETVGGWPLVVYEPTKLRRLDVALKRLFDVTFSVVGLFVCAPVLLVTAVLILGTSGPPVFFRQERCGANGRRFQMLKFRTMQPDAESHRAELAACNEMTGPVFKIADDPRVTPIGRYLRKYCVDELPQLMNVLLGDMSVVGPRPPLPDEVVQYGPPQRRRLSMKPGLTGTWQVSGPKRNQMPFEAWVAMDLDYIDRWSFTRDVELILRTIPAVFRGTGR